MLNLNSNITCLTAINDELSLWHRRLGHVSFDHFSRIGSQDVVKGIPKLKFEKDHICEACQFEKQTKTSFNLIKDIISTCPLGLMHMDLFGPTRTKSLGGTCYVYVLIDDYSRYIWVFFLEHKDEAFSYFRVICKRILKEKIHLLFVFVVIE